MKTCTNCKKTKPLCSFSKHKGKKDGLRSHCKDCNSASFKEASMYPDFKIKRKLLIREYRKNPEFKKRELIYNRQTNLKRSYGIRISDYDVMFKKQNGSCDLCGTHQSKLSRRLAVDHCHNTKKNRALLCDLCNPGLGYFKDSTDLLKKAISYLERHSSV